MGIKEMYQRRESAVPGGVPRPGQTVAEHDAEVAAYWGKSRSTDDRTPLTASQHILHLLLTIVTCGLWAPVWIWRSAQGNRSR